MFTLHIGIENLLHNATYLRKQTSAALCAVVKANAYGHGLEIAKYLNDYVDSYAVAFGEEAARLRKFTDKEIYVLCPSADIGDDKVIYSARSENDLQHKRVCAKINTGMNRLGMAPNEFAEFEKLCISKNVEIESVYTHFSDADYAVVQFEKFKSVGIGYKRHCCASNFLLLDRKYHLDMVRCGLALYGYGNGLKPVLSAYAPVYEVRNVKKGDKIGYSLTADRDMTVCIVGVGYADSIKRQKQYFFINGKVCETVGNICMDMCLVDVSGLNVKSGDTAEYIGRNIDGIAVAKQNNTIVYDILTSFGSRCRRIYE